MADEDAPDQLIALAYRSTHIVLPRLIEVITGEPGVVAVAACINAIRHAINVQENRNGQQALLQMVLDEFNHSDAEFKGSVQVADAIEESKGKIRH